MSHLAKILSLFLLATICCSLNASASRHSNDNDDDDPTNLIFDRQSYKNDSYVKLICTWYNPHRGVTKCKISAVKAKPGENDVPESKKRCEVWLSADRKLGGNETRVLRFGPDKAIVSWQAPTWRMSIVHFDNCTVYPTSDMWLRLRDFQPVSYVVYENSFDVVVGSEHFLECRIPSSGRDVPRCRITFDERGLPVHRDPDHRFWFNQTVRDDDMILEPLDQESPASGHLLIDTIAPDDEEANKTTTVRVAIVQPDGQILELRRYAQFWYKGVNPYKLVAHSTAHGLIGVCVGLIDRNKFTCSQFDRQGQLKFETTSDELSLSLEFDVVNLAEGGMLLTYIQCTGPGPCHSSRWPMFFNTARIDGSDGGILTDVFTAREWKACHRWHARGDVKLYEQQPEQLGHYCFTEICYKDPKKYPTDGVSWFDFKPICFTDRSQVWA